MVIQATRERHRYHSDRRDGQTADEQNTSRSTIHLWISISMRAPGSGAHPELSRIGHVKCSSLGRAVRVIGSKELVDVAVRCAAVVQSFQFVIERP
jgi:hypothetical protein